mmetsp:Transcript_35106/g.72167  ORF Transcript_35106/g.72167 Transcript_35106/m.72167 type:complete len:86 (-) Transcript_35106:3-260(-)
MPWKADSGRGAVLRGLLRVPEIGPLYAVQAFVHVPGLCGPSSAVPHLSVKHRGEAPLHTALRIVEALGGKGQQEFVPLSFALCFL